MNLRIGHGIDIHPYDEQRPLVLAAVRIAERDGLAGHSDADAVLHAIVDAILGAVGAGDIGEYFPSTDERWRGADSKLFVQEAIALLQEKGGTIVNLDVTIIAERPRLAPHRSQMRASLARLLEIDADRINVKATTTDHLGFIGRGEGLCAFATALFEFPVARSNE
jgi:2-C-methyl-D-erythritol 2,4-cyclodiphosphate synthase